MRSLLVSVALLMMVLMLTGCAKPQIVSPFSDGFSENEYLVIQVKDVDQLGLLFEAEQKTDAKGNPVPLKWRQTTIVLFPQSTEVNKVKITKMNQTRKAVEEVKSSSKFTATGVAELGATHNSVFKYQSESSKTHRIITPFKYNPIAKKYMEAKYAQNSNYKFSFMSALYGGSAFIEVFNKVDSKGTGFYAAFSIEGNYYTMGNRGIVTSGPIIYQLQPITLGELLDPPVDITMQGYKTLHITMQGYKPLNKQELNNIIMNLPENMRFLINPQIK